MQYNIPYLELLCCVFVFPKNKNDTHISECWFQYLSISL